MALRKVGPQGTSSVKTYAADAAVQRGYVVKQGASDPNCAPIATAGGRGIGIAGGDQALIGGAVGVTRFGDTIAIAGAAATAGQYATTDAAGRVVPATGAAGSGQEVIGRFESSTSAVGDECVLFVHPFIL